MANKGTRTGEGRMTHPELYELEELDRAILGALPDEGAKQGKYLPILGYVSDIRKKVEPLVSASSYGQRLGLMSEAGYVIKVASRTGNGRAGWQRTEKGKQAAIPLD